jgi:hypothetical protein
MVHVLIKINKATGDVSLFWNMSYLLLQRPLYCLGSSMLVMPFILKSNLIKSMIELASSSFWYPLARLTYGAYLSHSIFMLYRNLDSERGLWACRYDAFLMFFAYTTFAFIFSLFTTVLVELPCIKI